MANAIGSSSIASPPHSRKAVTITMQKGTNIILLCGVGKARLPALSKAQKPSYLWIRTLMRCNNQIQESSYRIPMFTMLLEARQNLKIGLRISEISHVPCLWNFDHFFHHIRQSIVHGFVYRFIRFVLFAKKKEDR